MRRTIKLKGETLGVWSLDDLTLKEAFLIKAATGLDPGPIQTGLGDGDPAAWQAVVWFLQCKGAPGLALADVDFRYGDLEVEDETDVPLDEETSELSDVSTSTSSSAGAD